MLTSSFSENDLPTLVNASSSNTERRRPFSRDFYRRHQRVLRFWQCADDLRICPPSSEATKPPSTSSSLRHWQTEMNLNAHLEDEANSQRVQELLSDAMRDLDVVEEADAEDENENGIKENGDASDHSPPPADEEENFVLLSPPPTDRRVHFNETVRVSYFALPPVEGMQPLITADDEISDDESEASDNQNLQQQPSTSTVRRVSFNQIVRYSYVNLGATEAYERTRPLSTECTCSCCPPSSSSSESESELESESDTDSDSFSSTDSAEGHDRSIKIDEEPAVSIPNFTCFLCIVPHLPVKRTIYIASCEHYFETNCIDTTHFTSCPICGGPM